MSADKTTEILGSGSMEVDLRVVVRAGNRVVEIDEVILTRLQTSLITLNVHKHDFGRN